MVIGELYLCFNDLGVKAQVFKQVFEAEVKWTPAYIGKNRMASSRS